ncbi:MAG: hypothetical protein R2827_15315 [Bdellovibrionales bacterium]
MSTVRSLTANEKRQLDAYINELDGQIGPTGGTLKTQFLSAEADRLHRELYNTEPDINTPGQLFKGGTPFERAQHFLIQHQLKKPRKPQNSSWVKWLAITMISLFAMGCLTLISLIIFFSPIIDMKNEGQVELFGGAIKLNDANFSIYQGGRQLRIQTENRGQLAVAESTDTLEVEFENGQLKVTPAQGIQEIQWYCQYLVVQSDSNNDLSPNIKVNRNHIAVKFEDAKGMNCDIQVPGHLKVLKVDGENGQLELNNISQEVDVAIENGRVAISPAAGTNYDWDLKVENGIISGATSADPLAAKTPGRVRLEKGQIQISK